MSEAAKQVRREALRDKLVDIAAELFYANGVRAVGVDEVVRRAGVAKASLYRWFPSKDDLVLAVLQRRDGDFWAKWDSTAAQHPDPREQLDAQLAWIQDLAMRTDYPRLRIRQHGSGIRRRRVATHQEPLPRPRGRAPPQVACPDR
ncbi:TetR/AcrR family transcriptional regulator [Rhodococcus pyridinivorans]|nr:TetR/AcrR family transcriptional regulator [Rhodococcus pyridinivorans]